MMVNLGLGWGQNLVVCRLRTSSTSVQSQKFNRLSEGSLSVHIFETQAATGREHFTCQDNGVPQIFVQSCSDL